MAKPKRPKASAKKTKPAAPSALPAGFWLSRQGCVVPVNIHAEALILMPDLFGLDRAPHGKDEVNNAMAKVIQNGWMRGRMAVGGLLQLQIWDTHPDSMRAIYDLVALNRSVKNVGIDTLAPQAWWQFTTNEFLMQAFPSSWRLGDTR